MNAQVEMGIVDATALFDLPTIERWLIDQVALLTDQHSTAIDVTQPFSAYALDSVASAGLTADLEDWLGRELPATLVWDYPSIELLARHLVRWDAA